MALRSKFNKAKILVIGAPGVGKTAFIVRFLTKRFIGEYDSNKETLYTHRTTLDKEEVTLDVLELGNENDDSQMENHIKWADGVLLIYSVTDKHSYELVSDHFKAIQRSRRADDYIPAVIAANKTDCPCKARKVSEADGKRLAEKHERPLFHISVAESADGPIAVIEDLLRQIKRESLKVKNVIGQKSTLTNVKRVFQKKYRSRSDTYVK